MVVPRNLLPGDDGYDGALEAMLTVTTILVAPVIMMAGVVRRRRLHGMNV